VNSRRIILRDAYKTFTLDQDKVLPPEQTVKKFKEKLKKLDSNILERTVRIDNGRLGIPVYVSICGADAKAVTGTAKQMGKGATPEQAEASAVMELAERYSFFCFRMNQDNFFVDTFQNVKDKAISFELIAQSVHDESESLSITRTIFERLPLKWTAAFNLTRQEPVLIPFDWFFTINQFNGPSAGNCREEALIQGICEVIERHVSSLISENRISVPSIRAESATDPMVIEMLQKYKNTNIKLYLSDFTMNMGIPSVGALAYDPSTFPGKSEIVWTAGTTPSPQKALSRALTEVAQLAGDFNTGSNYVASGLPKLKTLKAAEYIIRSAGNKDIADLPDLSDTNIKTEIERCVAVLSERGLEVIVVDTTHPLLQIPAFYTIIPGAHFRERASATSVGLFSAKLIAENQNPQAAIENLEAFDRTLPGQYYTMFYLGTCHIAAGNLEKALSCLQKAIALDPAEQDIPSIYSYMGVCLKEMGKYRKAIEILKQGAAYDTERTDIYNLMGFCYFKLKKHMEAIECFKKVIALDSGSAIDYANIGSNYREMGETEKAIQYYELALAMDPSIDFAWKNLQKLKPKISI